jgi:hypothetical protein
MPKNNSQSLIEHQNHSGTVRQTQLDKDEPGSTPIRIIRVRPRLSASYALLECLPC